ncbi:MAG: Nif3-like dinuclear metal center hexameric protein [Candidatus Helarchaeota archaeon]
MNLKEFLERIKKSCNAAADNIDFLKNVRIGYTSPSKQQKLQVKRILVTIDLRKKTISEAIQKKADVILTLIMSDFWKQNLTDEVLNLIRILLTEKIMVIQIPESWLFCAEGAIDSVASALELRIESFVNRMNEGAGRFLGRICTPKRHPYTYPFLFDLIKDKLGIDHFALSVRNRSNAIERILLQLTEPIQMKTILQAKEHDVDLILGIGLSHEIACACENSGMNAIDLTSFSLNVGISKLTTMLRIQLPELEFIFSNQGPCLTYS